MLKYDQRVPAKSFLQLVLCLLIICSVTAGAVYLLWKIHWIAGAVVAVPVWILLVDVFINKRKSVTWYLLDFIRFLVTFGGTAVIAWYLSRIDWRIGVISVLPVFILLLNTIGFLTLYVFGSIAASSPVTATREAVRVAPPTKDIDLNGMITEVDMKNLLAEISIGAAEGVKAGMRFHLTRNNKFICDIVILDVWPEKAVGWLELLPEQPQNQPKINDKVSIN